MTMPGQRIAPLKALTLLAGALFITPNVTHGAPQETLCVADLDQPVRVEVAATPGSRQRGLMQRESLAPYTGMLFRFDPPVSGAQGFYMYRTLIPLDIAFLDAAGRILALRTMSPCESRDPRRCRVYRPGTDYAAALEVNAGFFRRHQVATGDRIRPAQEGRCTPK